MPALEKISEQLIHANIQRAAADVFKIMLAREMVPIEGGPSDPVTPWPAVQAVRLPETRLWIGQVGFVGEINGFAYIYFETAFATQCVCRLLGVTEAELVEMGHETVKDAIGELTNMTVGSFKNGLCDAGFPCKLTIPAVFSVENFHVAARSTSRRYTHVFNSHGQRLVIDVLMKIED